MFHLQSCQLEPTVTSKLLPVVFCLLKIWRDGRFVHTGSSGWGLFETCDLLPSRYREHGPRQRLPAWTPVDLADPERSSDDRTADLVVAQQFLVKHPLWLGRKFLVLQPRAGAKTLSRLLSRPCITLTLNAVVLGHGCHNRSCRST